MGIAQWASLCVIHVSVHVVDVVLPDSTELQQTRRSSLFGLGKPKTHDEGRGKLPHSRHEGKAEGALRWGRGDLTSSSPPDMLLCPQPSPRTKGTAKHQRPPLAGKGRTGRDGYRGASETPAPHQHGVCPSPGWGQRGLHAAECTKTSGALSEHPANTTSESLCHHLLQVVGEEKGYRVQSYIMNMYLLLSGTGESGGYEVGSVKIQRKN